MLFRLKSFSKRNRTRGATRKTSPQLTTRILQLLPGLRIRAKIFGFPDRGPTREQNFLGCPTEFRPDPKLPENPKVARKSESGRVRVVFRARALGLVRAYSGSRMPELSENFEPKFGVCPTETRADSGFSEPDPNFPKPENPNAQPCSRPSALSCNRPC